MSYPSSFGSPTGRKVGEGGSITYQNFARNFGLSPSDMGKTVIVNTHNGYNLVLPDCRQLNSQRFIVIKNNATTNLLVTNNGGVGIKTVAPNSSVVLACTDITTANGVWAALAGTNLSALYAGTTRAVDDTRSTVFHTICALTNTTAIVFYKNNATHYVYASLLTVSGSTIDSTTPTLIDSVGTSLNKICACSLSTTKILLLKLSADNVLRTNVLNISGTTISIDSTQSISLGSIPSAQIYYCAVAKLDSTHAIISFQDVLASIQYTLVATISGNTASTGSVYGTYNGVTSDIALCALNAAEVVLIYRNNLGYCEGKFLQISGGTNISVNQVATIYNASTTQYQSICALDSTHAVAFYRGLSGYAYANALTISGTAISVGATYTIDSTDCTYQSITALNSTTAIDFYRDSNGYAASNILTINPSTGAITASAKTTVYNAVATSYESVCTLPNTTSFVGFYQGLSSYAYANVLAYTQ